MFQLNPFLALLLLIDFPLDFQVCDDGKGLCGGQSEGRASAMKTQVAAKAVAFCLQLGGIVDTFLKKTLVKEGNDAGVIIKELTRVKNLYEVLFGTVPFREAEDLFKKIKEWQEALKVLMGDAERAASGSLSDADKVLQAGLNTKIQEIKDAIPGWPLSHKLKESSLQAIQAHFKEITTSHTGMLFKKAVELQKQVKDLPAEKLPSLFPATDTLMEDIDALAHEVKVLIGCQSGSLPFRNALADKIRSCCQTMWIPTSKLLLSYLEGGWCFACWRIDLVDWLQDSELRTLIQNATSLDSGFLFGHEVW